MDVAFRILSAIKNFFCRTPEYMKMALETISGECARKNTFTWRLGVFQPYFDKLPKIAPGEREVFPPPCLVIHFNGLFLQVKLHAMVMRVGKSVRWTLVDALKSKSKPVSILFPHPCSHPFSKLMYMPQKVVL